MKIENAPFQTIDWPSIVSTEHPGEQGVAHWRTLEIGNVRVRIVEYAPGRGNIIARLPHLDRGDRLRVTGEYGLSVPTTFNEFITRALKPGVRPQPRESTRTQT